MRYILLLGPPGSGKGTQVELLKKEGFKVLITGDILRNEIEKNSLLGERIKRIVNKGELVPDDLIVELMETIIKEDTSSDKDIIIDGYPRTVGQVEGFLKNHSDEKIIAVYLKVDKDILKKRLTGRRVCPVCKRVYHIEYNPPKNDMKCDVCNEPLIIRKDDEPEVIENRLSVYDKQTQPIVELFENKGLLRVIDAQRTISEIFTDIKEILM